MLANERHNRILALLKQNGAITTAELVAELKVSLETVRRDLLLLERQGLLRRVHGGAVSPVPMIPFTSLPQRLERNPEKKALLCAIAVEAICENDIICIDSGSTAMFLARAIRDRFSRLTVITHSLDVFEVLRPQESFRLILCGGIYDESEKAFHGHLTLELLKQLHVQKVFLFPSAVSLRNGIRDHQPQLLAVQKKLLEIADRVFILADSEKYESTALLKLAEADPAYLYITDPDLPPHLRQLYREQGLRIITNTEEIRKESSL